MTASVRRTGRAIVVHEASRFCGYGAEVAARVTEQCLHFVEVPVPYAGRVTRLHAGPGDVVNVGQPLITVGPPEEAAPAEESGSVLIGYGTAARPRRRRAMGGREAAGPVPPVVFPACRPPHYRRRPPGGHPSPRR